MNSFSSLARLLRFVGFIWPDIMLLNGVFFKSIIISEESHFDYFGRIFAITYYQSCSFVSIRSIPRYSIY